VSLQDIRAQFRRNAVALISLFIAVTGLLYNTWRNEHSEYNRNQRRASFEVLIQLSELQQLVYLSYYDAETSDGSIFRRGWSKVLIIRDLSAVLDKPLPVRADELHGVWDNQWTGLEKHQKDSLNAIEGAIDKLRADTLEKLKELN